MSDTETTTAVATAVEEKKPVAPDIALRELVRKDGDNEVKFQPVWEPVQRGASKGVFYPAILPTEENWDSYVAFVGKKNIISALQAADRINSKATLDYVLNENDLWIEVPKMKDGKPVLSDTKDEETGEYLPEIEKAYYDYTTLPLEKVLELLEKGSIRGGVTIKDLVEDNKVLLAELLPMYAKIKNDPSILVRASEISEKIQSNEEQIKRIQASRKPRTKIAEGAKAA